MQKRHYIKIADAILENVKHEGYNDYRIKIRRHN